MIDALTPYPAYKASGVPWLGEVPAHWEIERLKAHASNIVEQAVERQNDGLYVALEHVESWTGRLRDTGFDAIFDSQVKRFYADDVLFGKLRPYLAKVTRPTRGGVCVGEFFVLRPRGLGISAPYLEHLLRSKPIIDAINSSTFGAKMPRADWQFVGSLRLSFPPLPEQSAIVRYLDHADRRIRRYIRAKQRLIALLNEQKQAIIHRAVTRGLDPNVRLKQSGVEWLGEVPEHWEVVRNKVVCHLGTGHTPSRKVSEYWVNCDIPWFTLSDVHQLRGDKVKYVYETKERVSQLGLANSAAVKLPRGTVILSRTASVGFSAILGCDMATSQDFMAWTPGERVNGEYLLAVLRAMRPEFMRLMYGSTHNTIYMPSLHAFQMPLPSRSEQAAIVNHIDGVTKQVDLALARAESEVGLLREYRTRLIADVVTGKFDVRAAAARLPDEAEEPEPLDEVDMLVEEDEETGLVSLDAVDDGGGA